MTGGESVPDDETASVERIRVERDADLRADPSLDPCDADALAAALPTGPREVAFRLPLVVAEEAILESVAGSDRVFVAELAPERETEQAQYVRQDRRGCWVPKAVVTVYELAAEAVLSGDRPESVESA